MKTATVTWITYNNYGTLLQAYALQKYVEMLGHENEIINDAIILKEYEAGKAKPKKKKASNLPEIDKLSRLKNLLSNPRRFGRALAARLDRETYEYPYYAVQNACEDFKRNEIKIRNGVSSENLAVMNADYDAFICGSDQVWSVFESIFNTYYYLDFATKKKIAYAPSLGTDKIPEATTEKVRELLSGFSAVSVRESVSANQLSAITQRDVEWVCDPTILHDREFWSDFADGVNVPKGKYLLCYFLENKPWYFDYAKQIADKLHLKIKLIPQKWDYLSNENIIQYAVGPKEFVALFENAEYVLTDSYHGSIFSLIFEKSFQYLLRFEKNDPNSQNVRIDSLFGYLEITDRIVDEDSTTEIETETKNYSEISCRLNDLRVRSCGFLEKSLR